MLSPGWLVDEGVRATLSEVETVLVRLGGTPARPDPVVSHLLTRPGKRVRPTLLLLAASLGDGDRDAVVQAAAAVELVHVGSLYHDDVMDRAVSRRGLPSANRLWGNGASLAAGSYLLARALDVFAGMGWEVNRAVAQTCADLCAGQLHEVELAFDLTADGDQVRQILHRKTGALLALPCRVGALLAGLDSRTTAALVQYGEQLGFAFQLVDDLLDFVSDGPTMGKAAHSDLRQGAYRLPVLLAARGGDATAARIRELLGRLQPTGEDLDEAAALIAASSAVAAVRREAREAAAVAVQALHDVPGGPAVESLRRLARFVTERAA